VVPDGGEPPSRRQQRPINGCKQVTAVRSQYASPVALLRNTSQRPGRSHSGGEPLIEPFKMSNFRVTFLAPVPSKTATMEINMRQFISRCLAIAVAVIFGLGTVSAAKYRDNTKDNSVTGSISAVDKGSQSITIHTAKGDSKVVLDSSTLITKNGIAATFDDIKTGADVVVGVFTFGDKLTAISVKIGAPQVAGTDAPKKKKKKDGN
jgi:hypothetical protein